ncbi:hypothetical protein FRB99_004869 [Tulasnella sp. 403]|nr:hypothetical protein FRB99_004869 [Tulasnella sp. 403]
MPSSTFVLPDFIAMCPFPLRTNSHYGAVSRASELWLAQHGVHPNEHHQKGFQACNFGLLTAMCYPTADRECFRVLCDFINCLFAFDDITDEGYLRKDGDGTKSAIDIVMDALRHPATYQTEFKVAKVIRDFWVHTLQVGCAPGTQRRFLEYTDLYLKAVHNLVIKRALSIVPDLESYIHLRRDTGALKMCFVMGEFGLGLDIPDEVFEHPLIKTMEDCANDVVVLSNDAYSYNIEQAQGDKCNIISVSMKEKNFDLQTAMDFSGYLVRESITTYLTCKAQLPSWGPYVDKDVRAYLEVLEDWMVGGFYWSLESQRYFGEDVEDVKASLVVKLLPSRVKDGLTEIQCGAN